MRTDIRLDLSTLGALIAGVAAFVVTGALETLAWILLAAVLGWLIGKVLERFVGDVGQVAEAEQLLEGSSRAELLRQAKRLGVEGRTRMKREELVGAIVNARPARTRR